MDARFVYVTCKDRDEARAIGRAVVVNRLAACANIIDGMESIYRWEGRLEEACESVVIFKTSEALVGQLVETVKAEHSYEVPCVVVLPIVAGNAEYLQWLRAET